MSKESPLVSVLKYPLKFFKTYFLYNFGFLCLVGCSRPSLYTPDQSGTHYIT